MVCLQKKKSCRASGPMVFICTAPKNWCDIFFSRYVGKLTIKLKNMGFSLSQFTVKIPLCPSVFFSRCRERWDGFFNPTECQVTWYLYAWHRKTDVTYFLVDILVKYYNQYKRPVLTKIKNKKKSSL